MKYYINKNKQPIEKGGNYEVHKETCQYYYKYISGDNFIYLGDFNSPSEAIRYAKNKYSNDAKDIDGCAYCCPRNNYE